MRKICNGLLAAALVLGLAVATPAEAKVYKMAPEERAAALKEKKNQKAKSKKSGKAAPGADQGGWVEVKPGDKPAKKNRKSKVDELAKAAEDKGKKGKKSKKDAAEAPAKAAKAEKAEKSEKKSKKSKAAGTEEIVVEKKGAKGSAKADKKSDAAADKQAETKATKKSGRKSASHGDRVLGSNYSGSKVSASSTEVRRPGGAPAPAGQSDELGSYSVSRPGQAPATPAVPEVRHEVQPGPVDAAKPLGTEHKTGEGRF
ncbi:MAG TPA: hypothetical protein VN419_04170 [Humidesulfovibrio sp.]|uniref:hypothetical protein n=1 Tax=Humidesulfovibrio sp. TaxID=2910988 RepID=UPI002CB5C229|nr:hypothetical protein [Humidesulfovibrio sp.]HWR03196.1 hypothetical protein [Humidesulfovibrio sp.]